MSEDTKTKKTMGRPRTNRKRINITLPEETHERLRELAKKHVRTVSDEIVYLVQKYRERG